MWARAIAAVPLLCSLGTTAGECRFGGKQQQRFVLDPSKGARSDGFGQPGGRLLWIAWRSADKRDAVQARETDQRGGSPGRVWPWVCVALLCFFLGFLGWAYQGYEEDYGSAPTQSWPLGAGGYLLGGLLTLMAIRQARPWLKPAQLMLIGVLLAAGLVAAAFGATDAGNG